MTIEKGSSAATHRFCGRRQSRHPLGRSRHPIVGRIGQISPGLFTYTTNFCLDCAVSAPSGGSLVTFVVAAISWHAFERPVNGLKRHFRYTKPDVVPADAVAAST